VLVTIIMYSSETVDQARGGITGWSQPRAGRPGKGAVFLVGKSSVLSARLTGTLRPPDQIAGLKVPDWNCMGVMSCWSSRD
jgi:hypothetical protein